MHMAEQLYAPWQGRQVPNSYKFAVSAVQQERAGETLQDHLQSGAFAMGNPDTIIKVLKKYQEAGLAAFHLKFWSSLRRRIISSRPQANWT